MAKKYPPTQFTPEHIAQLKYLSGLKVGHIEEHRHSGANPESNPHVFGAHQAILAHSYATGDLHGEWEKIASSPEYLNATPGQRLRIQRDHLTQFHANNPQHYSESILGVHGKAQQAQHAAQVAHRQAEHGKLTAALSGVTPTMGTTAPSEASIRDQLGAASGAQESGRKDEIASIIAEQTASAPAAATQRRIAEELGSGVAGEADQQQASMVTGPKISPEAAAEALKAAKFKNLPSEQVEVGGLKGRRTTEEHPDLRDPANKRLLDRLAATHLDYLTERRVHRRAKYLTNRGIHQEGYDTATAQDAALTGMYKAAANFDPSLGKDFDEYVRQSIDQAIDGHLMQQHRAQTGGAAAAGQKAADAGSRGSAAPVRTYTEEELKALPETRAAEEQARQARKAADYEGRIAPERLDRLNQIKKG